ncbi:MAG: hypothetical protein BGP04_16855 [Rhizobiales bacterium 62-17]|nr:MAG: hypothetical protein BGP04_16855 [Rhizobiales bacterium 62-17]
MKRGFLIDEQSSNQTFAIAHDPVSFLVATNHKAIASRGRAGFFLRLQFHNLYLSLLSVRRIIAV